MLILFLIFFYHFLAPEYCVLPHFHLILFVKVVMKISSFSTGVHPVIYKWVYIVKYNLDHTMDKYKAWLIAKRFLALMRLTILTLSHILPS